MIFIRYSQVHLRLFLAEQARGIRVHLIPTQQMPEYCAWSKVFAARVLDLWMLLLGVENIDAMEADKAFVQPCTGFDISPAVQIHPSPLRELAGKP